MFFVQNGLVTLLMKTLEEENLHKIWEFFIELSQFRITLFETIDVFMSSSTKIASRLVTLIKKTLTKLRTRKMKAYFFHCFPTIVVLLLITIIPIPITLCVKLNAEFLIRNDHHPFGGKLLQVSSYQFVNIM